MAGEDTEFNGEAWPAKEAKVGYLHQEPRLDDDKTVAENVMEGLGGLKALVDRFNEVSNAFAEPDADFDALIAEQAELQEKIDAAGAWDLDRTIEIAMDALRCPPGEAKVSNLSGGERRRARQRELDHEAEWIRQSPKARQSKQKARIQAYEELLNTQVDKAPEAGQIVIPPGPRLGDLVIEAQDLRKGFGNHLLIEDLSFKEQPDGGSLRIGDTVKLGYVDQSRDTLKADNTIWQEVSEGADVIHVGNHDRWFLDRVATHILAFEGDSRAVWYEGNFQDYEEDKKRRLGDAAVEPHRIKYKPLTR
ncbi:ettA [Symbiodinium necroappetens]|uniref:EttA protein n=1 Tax=Symbiodinium necroappetens TaxID=1628268 RepID=A0A812QAV2_9DINO|nr:ettA [Symbiodinium necroappetens]